MNATPNAVNTNDQTEQAQGNQKPVEFDRTFWAPDELEKAQTAINAATELCNARGLSVVYNFDPEKDELPDGYGLALIPLRSRTDTKGNVTTGIVIAGVPSPDAVSAAGDNGQEFIYKVIVDRLLSTVANAARPRGDSATGAASLPFSINDFITSQRSEALQAWRKLSGDYVKALKDKGIKLLTAPVLRQVLESREFAEQMFPKIPQESWQMVLDSMIGKAKKDKLDATALEHWKETRDSVEVTTGELDLSDLGDIMGGNGSTDAASQEATAS